MRQTEIRKRSSQRSSSILSSPVGVQPVGCPLPIAAAQGTASRLAQSLRRGALLLSCVALLCASGCFSMKLWERRPQMSKLTPPLSPNSTSEEILARVNLNAYSEYSPKGLKSYRCDDVSVRMKGIPAPMRASIVVEAPRNLRLRVAHPLTGGEALDIGSNEQQFWFWSKESQPANVLVCSHDQIAEATQVTSLPLPFRPDWLMEVLGVSPISGTEYEVRRAKPRSPIVELVSVQRTPDQKPVRRIVTVDTKFGVVLEHRVESIEGQMIAKAVLSQHSPDPKTRLVMPHQIAIDWPTPEQHLSLSLVLNTIDFNAPTESVAMWSVPRMKDYPQFDLGAYAVRELGRSPSEISAPAPRDRGVVGRSKPRDDNFVVEVIEDDAVVDREPWSDPSALDTVDRPIRSASSTERSRSFDVSPTDPLGDESPAPGGTDHVRPFPRNF